MNKDSFLHELLGRMSLAETVGQLQLLTGAMADTRKGAGMTSPDAGWIVALTMR